MDQRTKPLPGVLAAALVVVVVMAGCDRSEPERRASPVESPHADTVTVPNVLHTDLQVAYRRLTKAGLKVSFGRLTGRANYKRYATQHPSAERQLYIEPAPHVGDMDPRPGEGVARGTVVAILAIECPNGLTSCD